MIVLMVPIMGRSKRLLMQKLLMCSRPVRLRLDDIPGLRLTALEVESIVIIHNVIAVAIRNMGSIITIAPLRPHRAR